MKQEIISITKKVFNVDIDVLIMTKSGKWYEQQFEPTDSVEVGQSYGVSIDGAISFSFKAAKNEDNIIKSFITNFISKYELNRMVLFNGEIVKQTRAMLIESLGTRLYNGIYYATNYGIGFFCFFHGKQAFAHCTQKMDTYLTNCGIAYKNEFSEAHWVYRYLLTSGNKPNNTAILASYTD